MRNQDALLSTPYGRYAANKHPGLRDTLGAPLVEAAFFAQIDSDGSAWFIDEHVVKRRAPLKAVVHKILIVNLKKKKQEFWTHLFHQHPQVHPEDLRALAAEIDGAAK